MEGAGETSACRVAGVDCGEEVAEVVVDRAYEDAGGEA